LKEKAKAEALFSN